MAHVVSKSRGLFVLRLRLAFRLRLRFETLMCSTSMAMGAPKPILWKVSDIGYIRVGQSGPARS